MTAASRQSLEKRPHHPLSRLAVVFKELWKAWKLPIFFSLAHESKDAYRDIERQKHKVPS
jgi:hypothetical protein